MAKQAKQLKTFEITVSMTAWKTITVQAESEDDISIWDDGVLTGIMDDLEYSDAEITDITELETAL